MRRQSGGKIFTQTKKSLDLKEVRNETEDAGDVAPRQKIKSKTTQEKIELFSYVKHISLTVFTK